MKGCKIQSCFPLFQSTSTLDCPIIGHRFVVTSRYESPCQIYRHATSFLQQIDLLFSYQEPYDLISKGSVEDGEEVVLAVTVGFKAGEQVPTEGVSILQA